MPRFLRNLFAALAFGLPTFSRAKDEASEKAADPVESIKPSRLQPGGKLEEVNKQYGRTIAGGPGSQKIGDAFDALPPAVRAEMIAARKGRIVRVGETGFDRAFENSEGAAIPGVFRRHGTDAIAHALSQHYENRGGRLVPRTDAKERVDHATRKALIGKDD